MHLLSTPPTPPPFRSYGRARIVLEQLLAIEPNNRQAIALGKQLERAVLKDGITGMALVGGVVAVGAAVLIAALRKR